MSQAKSAAKRVVLLVDSRRRDLPVAALIAHQLEELGLQCFLEPLEAYRGVLAAHRPHLIVFNHILASHLEKYSQRLGQMGVRTAVLLNEGILYDEGEMKYNAGRFHNDAHIDYYFCWNEPHAQALRAEGFDKTTRIEVIGVPRFDFYKEPWSRVFYRRDPSDKRERPKVLVCTNFVCAKFHELPKEEGDKFFAAWKDRIPLHRDYWTAIGAQHRARARAFDFLDELVAADEFDIVLRPHPNEEQSLHHAWFDKLDAQRKRHVHLDLVTNITTQILDCDLEISCETCTTALEAWMAGKPTVELTFEKYPLWFHHDHGAANELCGESKALVPLVRKLLREFDPSNLPAARVAHLKKWCDRTDGQSCRTLAGMIADAVKAAPEPDWTKLTADDKRRGLKLKSLQSVGLPYHFNPFLPLKRFLRPQKYAVKTFAYSKSIRPADVAEMRARIQASQQETPAAK